MATTQHRPHGAFAGPLYGTLDGKTEDTGPAAVEATTQHRPHGAFAGSRYGTLSGKGAGVGVPTITSVTPVSGTALSVAWTGTATEYRLDGGAAVTLPDGTSPDTISGLTAATTYAVQLRDGAGAWSTAENGTTDTTGSGGGSLNEVTPSSGALRFTGYVPTVARTANQWAAPTAGALRFTGYAPTVARTGSIDVFPLSGALRFTGYAPAVIVSAPGNQTIAPLAGALRFTGYAPAVTNVGASYTSAGVLYVPIRMVSALWSGVGVGSGAGQVAWLPPQRQAVAYQSNGQWFCDPTWYRFFEYLAETRLGGKTAPTLTAVAAAVTTTQTASAAASASVTELQQQTSANAEALFAVRTVAKLNLLDGADQIPAVEL